jgi:hypothetical protein
MSVTDSNEIIFLFFYPAEGRIYDLIQKDSNNVFTSESFCIRSFCLIKKNQKIKATLKFACLSRHSGSRLRNSGKKYFSTEFPRRLYVRLYQTNGKFQMAVYFFSFQVWGIIWDLVIGISRRVRGRHIKSGTFDIGIWGLI